MEIKSHYHATQMYASQTETDSYIPEEPWNDKLEKYMGEYIKTATVRATQHEAAGYYFKKLNTRWGLPLVLLPMTMSPVSLMIGDIPGGDMIKASAFMLSGMIAGVYSFFRYGEKLEKHFGFAARYSDVVTDIQAILVKGRQFRGPADVFSTKIRMIMDNLAQTEPTLPRFILDDKQYTDTHTNQPTHYQAISRDDIKV